MCPTTNWCGGSWIVTTRGASQSPTATWNGIEVSSSRQQMTSWLCMTRLCKSLAGMTRAAGPVKNPVGLDVVRPRPDRLSVITKQPSTSFVEELKTGLRLALGPELVAAYRRGATARWRVHVGSD